MHTQSLAQLLQTTYMQISYILKSTIDWRPVAMPKGLVGQGLCSL